jgi:hypothetical protein
MKDVDMTPIYNERLAVVLGLFSVLAGLSVFFSCRVCISWLTRLGMKNLTKSRGYSGFYRYHVYYWWTFGVVVVAHFMIATLHTGLPQADDPDANTHWIILGLGILSFITALVLFTSCRILPRLASMLNPQSILNNTVYKILYRYHVYYWGILILLVAAHFGVSYNHTGLWPGE